MFTILKLSPETILVRSFQFWPTFSGISEFLLAFEIISKAFHEYWALLLPVGRGGTE